MESQDYPKHFCLEHPDFNYLLCARNCWWEFYFFTGLVFSFSFSLETPMGSKSSLDLSPRVLLDGIIGRSFFILGKIDLCLLETLMMDVLLINMSLIWKIIKKHYLLPSLMKLYLISPVIPIIQVSSTRSHREKKGEMWRHTRPHIK